MKDKEKKILIILITALVLLDQIIKIIFLVSNAKIGNVEGFSLGILNLERSENNATQILLLFIVFILVFRYITNDNSYIKTSNRVVLGFTLAGIISNFIDRIWKGTTINYINITKTLNVNLGDIYFLITWIGLAVILTIYTSNRIKEKKIRKEMKK